MLVQKHVVTKTKSKLLNIAAFILRLSKSVHGCLELIWYV